MRIAWTGHRPNVFADPWQAQQAVRAAAQSLLREGATEFRVGGQRGVDLWAGEMAVELNLPLCVVLPTLPSTFVRYWAPSEARRLQALLDQANAIAIADPAEALGPLAYDRRNELLISTADVLQAVWTGLRQGGTFYTLCAARAARVRSQEVRLTGISGPAPGRGL